MKKKVFYRFTVYILVALCLFSLMGSQPAFAQGVTVTADQTIASKFLRHTVTGITTALPTEPDVPGLIGASYITVADIDQNGVLDIIATSGIGPNSDMYTSDGEVVLFTWDGSNKDAWTKTIIANAQAIIDHDSLLSITPKPARLYYLGYLYPSSPN